MTQGEERAPPKELGMKDLYCGQAWIMRPTFIMKEPALRYPQRPLQSLYFEGSLIIQRLEYSDALPIYTKTL